MRGRDWSWWGTGVRVGTGVRGRDWSVGRD